MALLPGAEALAAPTPVTAAAAPYVVAASQHRRARSQRRTSRRAPATYRAAPYRAATARRRHRHRRPIRRAYAPRPQAYRAPAPRRLQIAHAAPPRLRSAPGKPPLSTAAPRAAASAAPRPTPLPRLRADATSAQALAQALGLSAPALARIAAHAELLDAPAPDAAKAVAAAEATRAALFDALAPRMAESDLAERQLARELLAGLAQALPGVAMRLPADVDAAPESGIDYAALARALPPGTPGQALLAVAGGLRSPFGPPGYLLGACADFGRVTSALGKLPGAWQAAPAALRARLQAPLRDAVVRMGEQADFCPEERRARAAAREAARLLGRLQAFGGPGTGKRIGHNFRSYGLRFGLAPGPKP